MTDKTRHDGAGFLLAQVGRLATRRFTRALTPTGLKPRHGAALVQLRDRGAISQQALGDTLGMDPSNLVALLNDLEEDGLALRRRDPADRRRHIVEISEQGAHRLAKAELACAVAEDELLAALDEDERVQLQALLARVVRSTAPEGDACVDDDADMKAAANLAR